MILCDHLPWALVVPRNLLEDRQRHHGGSGRKLHGKAGRELSRTVRWVKAVIYNPALVPTLSLCFACFRIPRNPRFLHFLISPECSVPSPSTCKG